MESGSYSINRPSSLRGTPNGTPRGTPTRGSQRGSLTAYGALFSGGSRGGTSPMPGSLPSRAVMSNAAALSSHSLDRASPSRSVMTPPPHAILSGAPEPQGRRLPHAQSRNSLLRSQDLLHGGKPV